jgi:hypothetical protein
MWATCAGQVSRFLLSLKTVQYGLPFRRHGTSTTVQIVRVERESHLGWGIELSPFQETASGAQLLSTTELSHYKVTTDYDKVFSTLLTNTSAEQQESAHQQTAGWFASFFRAPPRHRHVEVDADAASWWVEGEDRGPGMQESQIGRYDAWL